MIRKPKEMKKKEEEEEEEKVKRVFLLLRSGKWVLPPLLFRWGDSSTTFSLSQRVGRGGM